MTSEERPEPELPGTEPPGTGEPDALAVPGDPGSLDGPDAPDGSDGDRGRLNLTDPKAMRALAHPLRWALLDALGQAGTLTATQASEMLGESPANCAFHLRTLAKYGFVEEAGGGRGRERPWRQAYSGMSWRSRPEDDDQTSQAAQALDQVWLDRSLTRAQRSLTSRSSWPKAFGDVLGGSTSRLYLTPAEAEETYAQIQEVFERLVGSKTKFVRRKDPAFRPPDAVPVEMALLGYPILDLPPLPGKDDGSGAGSGEDETDE